jgi:hypothetical protein
LSALELAHCTSCSTSLASPRIANDITKAKSNNSSNKMKGNFSDEKDASISFSTEACDDPATEVDNESILRDPVKENKGAMENKLCTDKAEVPYESGTNDKECAINSKELGANDKTEEMEEDEQWDLKKIMSIAAVNCTSPIKCSHETCNLVAATVWVSNLKPSENWYSCLDCQVRERRRSYICSNAEF